MTDKRGGRGERGARGGGAGRRGAGGGMRAGKAGRPEGAAKGAGKSDAGPVGGDDVRDLLLAVSRVAGAFEAVLRTREPKLSLSQWAMLETLEGDKGDARPALLARKLGFSRQLVRQTTKRLEAVGLVQSSPAEEGKKAVGVHLTDAGRQAAAGMRDTGAALAAKLASEQPTLKLSGANRALKTLGALLAAEAPEQPKGAKAGAEEASEDREED